MLWADMVQSTFLSPHAEDALRVVTDGSLSSRRWATASDGRVSDVVCGVGPAASTGPGYAARG